MNNKAVAERGGIKGEGHLGAVPQAHNPTQEGYKTMGHSKRPALASGFARGLETPFGAALLDGGDRALEQACQQRGDREAATGTRQRTT
ncbi:MAG: hypothetical protein AAGF95_24820, partial [Chloroflexota bacterium]